MCRNCHALKRDYGQALYERDLQIANFRPRDVLKHDEADGMDIFLFSLGTIKSFDRETYTLESTKFAFFRTSQL